MKNVVVTGATGFIGGALTKHLLQNGVKVWGVDIDSAKLEEMKQFGDFVPITADFSLYGELDKLIGQVRPDVFYHFAWQGVFGDAFKDYELQLNNARFACDALMCAARLGCGKFVLAGTYNQYEIATRLLNECTSPRYTCVYSTAKTAADMICKTLAHNVKISYCAGLICMAYGEGNRSRMLANVVIDQLSRGVRPKLIQANGLYDMIYISDIVGAFVALGQKGKDQKSYYVGHRKARTFGEIISEIRDTLCPQQELLFGEYQETACLDYALIDREALFEDTGFVCRADFKESILRTAEWITMNMEKNVNGGG